MSICWYCHWGWPKQVTDIYDKYVKLITDIGGNAYTAMNYGPAHIVWDDENFDKEEHIQWCINNAQKYRSNLTDEEVVLVVQSLQELLALPDEILNCVPEDYDDENPDNYPPPSNLIMVKR